MEVPTEQAMGSVENNDPVDDTQYPWDDVDSARRNRRLQRQHPIEGAAGYREAARPCPKCGTPGAELAWFYFKSPKSTWEHECGCAGWMAVCDRCRFQVEFFMELMN